MRVDLTPAELREFVRLWRTEPRTMAETSALRKLERRIPTFLPTTLALALADAMEDLEAERGRRRKTYCAYCGYEEAVDMDGEKIARHIATCEKHPMRKVEADLEAAREIVRAATFIGADGRPCWTGCYGVSPVPDSQAPAVRAAWEGK